MRWYIVGGSRAAGYWMAVTSPSRANSAALGAIVTITAFPWFLCRASPVRVGPTCGTVRLRYRHAMCITHLGTRTPHTGIVCGHTGLVQGTCGPFTVPTVTVENPKPAHQLVMHALKLCGPHTGRQNSHSAVQLLSKTALEQPVQDTVWCDCGTIKAFF